MYIQLSELKTNPARYFDLAKKLDVIVTRHGKRIGRIVSEEKAAKTERANAFDALMLLIKNEPSKPDAAVYHPAKEKRLHERGLL